MECPHCGGPESYEPIDLMIHLRNEHPMTWIMWVAASVSADGFADTVAALLDLRAADDFQYWVTVSELLESANLFDVETLAPLCEPKEDSTCSICLKESCDNLSEGTQWRKICPCGHVFCAPCIEQWLRVKQLCPLCREVPREDVEYIARPGSLFTDAN